MNQIAPCPHCGEPARRLCDVFADHIARVRQAESQPPPSPGSEPPPAHIGSGIDVSGDQLLVGAVMQVLLDVSRVAVEAAIAGPAAEWWQAKVKPAMRERRERVFKALGDAIDRHPELSYCTRDDAVFLPGSLRTLPAKKVVEILMKRDDARLISLLNS